MVRLNSWGRLVGRGSAYGWLAAAVLACALPAQSFGQAAPPAAAPAAGAAANTAPAATEGGYKVLVVYERMKTDRAFEAGVKTTVRNVLSANKPLSENQRAFDAYYTLYLFPMMTRVDAASLKSLPEDRMKFLRYDLEVCRSPEVQGHLTRLTFDEMLPIVRDPEFHPAVRYNALIILGSLNDREVVRLASAGAVPEPMARALPVLLEEFRRPENSDALKVAALIGISRHLEWEPHRTQGSPPIPAPVKAEALNAMLALAQDKAAPEGRSPQGHLWFRRRAIEALGLASAAKTDPAVATALEALMKDDAEPLAIRFASAAAFGRIKQDPAAKVNVESITKELGYLALQACDSELKRVTELRKTEQERAARMAKGVSTFTGMESSSATGGSSMEIAGAGGFVPDIGLGGSSGGQLLEDPKGYRFDPVRRRIRYYLYCVQLGLNGAVDKNPSSGIAVVAKQPKDVELVSNVASNVVKLAQIVEEDAFDMAQLDKDLRKAMKELEKYAKKAPPAAPPPGDVPGGDLPGAPAAPGAAAASAAAASGDVPAPAPARRAPAADAPAADVPAADVPAADVPAAGAADAAAAPAAVVP